MDIAVSQRVIARNSMGQFISAFERGVEESVREMVGEGARLSRAMAPTGTKADDRTPSLKNSIEEEMLSPRSGIWYSTARHALPIEKGAVPHPISGMVNFFWEREQRDWEPGLNIINHPGNRAQPFLRPAYETIMGRALQTTEKHMP